MAYKRMMELSSAEEEASHSGLIPSLPDDVFLKCLVKVPLQWHANLQRVSRALRDLVQSSEYYAQRKTEAATNALVCMLQPVPMSTKSLEEKISSSSTVPVSDPVYGITVLDVENSVWERLPGIPGLPSGLPLFCKLVIMKGELVVLGGWWQITWKPSKVVFVYNFSSQRWRRGADMPNARNFFAVGAVGDKIVVAGGHDEDKKALASVEAFDLETNAWVSLPSMREERDECTGVVVDGMFYVVSGYGSDSQGNFRESGEVFDPARNSWTFVDNMWPFSSPDSDLASPSSLATMAGNLYGVLRKEIVVYSQERNAWTVVATIPEESEKGELTSSSITAIGNRLVITGFARKNNTVALRILSLAPAHGACKAQWHTIEANDQFLNLSQASCAIEL